MKKGHSWIVLHRESERLASEAEIAMRNRRFPEAIDLYAKAARQEEQAALALEPNKKRTIGITAVSAAALHYKAGAFDDAAAVANRWLRHPGLKQAHVDQLCTLLKAMDRFEENPQ